MKSFLKSMLFASAIFLNIILLNAQELKNVTLQLKWKHQFQFAGYYAAIEKGYYAAAGLEVTLLEATEGVNPSASIFNGKADFGVGSTDILLFKSPQNRAVVLATIFQHSPEILIASKKSGINNIHHLIGKHIAMEPNAADIIAYMNDEGISLSKCTIDTHSFNVNMLINGEIDAISAYTTDEPFILDKANFEYSIISPLMGGIDFYGDVLFTSQMFVQNNPETTNKFRKASLEGWKYAMRHPDEIARLIHSKYSSRHSIEHLNFEADKMKTLIMADVVEVGYTSEGRWKSIVEVYKKTKMLGSSFSTDGLFYTDYLKPETVIPWRWISIFLVVCLIIGSIAYFFYRSFIKLKKEINNRLKVEKELVDSEEQLSLAILGTTDGLWDWNLATNSVYFSPTWKSLVGYAEDELENNFSTWEKLLHPEDLQNAKDYLNDYLNKEHLHYENEFRMVHKNGEHVIILSRAIKQFYDASGKLTRLVGTHENITSIRKAEAQIRQLSTAVEQSPTTIVITDITGKIEYSNSKFTELTGYTAEEAKGLNPSILKSGKTDPELYNDLWATILSGRTWQGAFINRKKNGEEFIENAVIAPIFDNKGAIINFVAIKTDITERVKAEKALIESEDKYRTMIEYSNDLIWILDVDGNFTFFNEIATKTTGLDIEQWKGKSFVPLILEEDLPLVMDVFRRNIHGEACNYELRFKKTDGVILAISVNTSPIFIAGKFNGVVSFGQDITERKIADEKLRESEEKFRVMANMLPQIVFETDIQGRLTYVNQQAYKTFGFADDFPILGLNNLDFHSKESRIRAVEDTKNKIMGKNVQESNEYTLIRHDGTPFQVLVFSNPIIKNGEAIGLRGIVVDITEHKQAQEALRKSEEKFKTIIETSPDGIAISSLNGRLEFVTSNVITMWGFDSAEELLGRNVMEFVHPSYHAKAISLITEMINGNLTGATEYLMVRKDGSEFYCEANANVLHDANNNPIGILYIERDITERKLAEDALKANEEKYRMLFNSNKDSISIIAINENGLPANFVEFNDAACDTFGYKREELFALNLKDLEVGATEDMMKWRIETLHAEGKVDFETIVKDKQGNNRTLEVKVVLVNYMNKPALMNISRDITERKKAEELLRKANIYLESATKKANEMAAEAELANKSKSIFLANMSHEIRTPLNAIIGFSQLINRDKLLSDTQKEYNISIIRASEHLLALINDILELSKVEAGRVILNPTNIDLHAFLKDIQMLFKERTQFKHLKFLFETTDELPQFVMVDESKLRQIFFNLIGNAIKFTDAGGIAVRVRVNELGDKKRQLLVEVQDSGNGIAEDEQRNLFQHFVQTSSGIKKGSGTGLGLALSRELAVLMGGNITVASEIGKGSTFTFHVEIADGKKQVIEKITAKRVINIKNNERIFRILVVDDKAENLKVVVNLLKIVGFETYEAVNGQDAIAKFEQLNPDLILMDLRMPVMDGYEATQIIKSTEKGFNTPIVILTANTFEGERKKIESLGIQGYICKPFRENDLFSTIAATLGLTYNYEDDKPIAQLDYLDDDQIIAEISAKLPDALAMQMIEAVASADLDLLLDLMKSLESDHPIMARYLQRLANNYEYDLLQDILQKIK